MKILYIHGLKGSLNPEKRAILEKYGEAFSPSIDYMSDSSAINGLINSFQSEDIDVVIGSSMGGFSGYYVSNAFQCPALLFNPALAERSVFQNIPDIEHKTSAFKQIVLGTLDDVVDPKKTLNFLSETLVHNPEFKINIHNDLAHRIPLPVFEKEVKLFFENLNIKTSKKKDSF